MRIYYDALRRKIEERGTRDFPEYRGRKLYGELTMNVTVDAEGRVVETEIVRPSSSTSCSTGAPWPSCAPPRPSAPSARRCAARPTRSSSPRASASPATRAASKPRLSTHARDDVEADACPTVTPCSAIRSRTASRRSSMPSSRARPASLEYSRCSARWTASPQAVRAFADSGRARLQRHRALQVRGRRAGQRG